MVPFSTAAPSLSSTRLRFALGSPGASLACSEMKLAMELKRAIRSGVSAPPCQYGGCHCQGHPGRRFVSAPAACLIPSMMSGRVANTRSSLSLSRAAMMESSTQWWPEYNSRSIATCMHNVGFVMLSEEGGDRRSSMLRRARRVEQAASRNARCKSWSAKSI